MKTLLSFFAFVAMIFISEISKAQITFQKTYDGLGGVTSGYSVQQTTDSGYVIVGSTASNGSSLTDIFSVKTDVYGNIIWSKTYGRTNRDIGYTVEQTIDGGFIIAGYSEGQGLIKNTYLIKTNFNGDTLWTRTYNGYGDNVIYSVHQTFDNGYIMTGHGGGFNGTSPYGICLIKTNMNGDTLWTRVFGSYQDFGKTVEQTQDSGFVFTGTLNGDIFLIKTDINGDTLWTKDYGTGHGEAVRQTFDGGYVITGTTLTPANWLDYFLYKTNSNGNIIWAKTYGGANTEWANDVRQTTDSGYVISGYTTSFGSSIYSSYLIKTNSAGDTLWTKIYGNNGGHGQSVKQTYDGGYIIGGNIENPISYFYLIKTDDNGNSNCNQDTTATITGIPVIQDSYHPTLVSSCNVVPSISSNTNVQNLGTMTTICISVSIAPVQNSKSQISISPNPFSFSSTLTISENVSLTDLTLSVFNIYGRMVRTLPVTSHESVIERNGLAAGIYFYKLTSGITSKAFGKLIIQ